MTVTQTDYKNFLEGRSVALIGGDDDIDWNRVNECSVVVRVNDHWKRQRGRCDVLYYSCARDIGVDIFSYPELYSGGLEWCWLNKTHHIFAQGQNFFTAKAKCAEHKVKQLQYWHAPMELFHLCEPLQHLQEEELWTKELSTKYSFHPLTGLLALEHIRLSGAWTIYVTGMSLYREPNGALPGHAGAHSIPPQVSYLRDLMKDDRITYSPVLLRSIDAATQ